jgi:hypothetical protein
MTPAHRKKNKRLCPAMNGLISVADFGAQRGSKLNCPADCPFYPFSPKGYDLLLKLNESLGPKAIGYAVRHLGADRFKKPAKPRFSRKEDDMTDVVLANSHALFSALFFERDPAGCTLADRWEAEGWTGLDNDQRNMMQHGRHSYVTVMEVQKILDHQSTLCVDVFSPSLPAFVLMDRTCTPTLARFTRLLAWIFHYPHFSCLGGASIQIEFYIWPFWNEILEKRLIQEQAIEPDLTLREFLTQDFIWAIDVLSELGLDYRRRAFQSVDFYHCVATYRLLGAAPAVAAVLQNKPDFAPLPLQKDEGFALPLAKFTWLRRGESAQIEQSMIGVFRHSNQSRSVGTVGNVRLYRDKLIIEAFSKRKYFFARQMLDKYLGALIRFEEECITDAAHLEMRKQQPIKVSPEVMEVLDRAFSGPYPHGIQVDASWVIAPETTMGDPAETILSQKTAAERTLQYQLMSMLDDRIPMLHNHTPRECARDASLRPLLIEWIKGYIHNLDATCLRDGVRMNVDWVLNELGLTELK